MPWKFGGGARAALLCARPPPQPWMCTRAAHPAPPPPPPLPQEGQGSLIQCVLSPGYGEDPKLYMPLPNEEIVRRTHEQVMALFPSARGLKLTWSSVVKIMQSLYREAPGLDAYRPDQATPVPNFFLAGSYTKQDYIDSMEGATLSGRQCAGRIGEVAAKLQGGTKAAAKAAPVAAAAAA